VSVLVSLLRTSLCTHSTQNIRPIDRRLGNCACCNCRGLHPCRSSFLLRTAVQGCYMFSFASFALCRMARYTYHIWTTFPSFHLLGTVAYYRHRSLFSDRHKVSHRIRQWGCHIFWCASSVLHRMPACTNQMTTSRTTLRRLGTRARYIQLFDRRNLGSLCLCILALGRCTCAIGFFLLHRISLCSQCTSSTCPNSHQSDIRQYYSPRILYQVLHSRCLRISGWDHHSLWKILVYPCRKV